MEAEAAPKKEFVLTHVVENVSKLDEGVRMYSKPEEHFNVPWLLQYSKTNEHLTFHVTCDRLRSDGNWSINVDFVYTVTSSAGKTGMLSAKNCRYGTTSEFMAWGFSNFMRWEDVEKLYAIADRLILEVRIVVTEMSGIEKPKKLKGFDNGKDKKADVTLLVGEEKFRVSRLVLANQSTYFESLFLGEFAEATQEEITLNAINPEEFQIFLELVYMEPSLTDTNIEGVLVLTDMFDAKHATRLCEDFLVYKSNHSLRNKLSIGLKYKLEAVKKHCLESLKSTADVRAVMSAGPMDVPTLTALLEKSLALK